MRSFSQIAAAVQRDLCCRLCRVRSRKAKITNWQIQIAFLLKSVKNIGLFGMVVVVLVALVRTWSRDFVVDECPLKIGDKLRLPSAFRRLLVLASHRRKYSLPHRTLS